MFARRTGTSRNPGCGCHVNRSSWSGVAPCSTPLMEQPAPPVMFAIVGDSAAGKTTLASGIAAFLGSERVLEICTDDYHRYDRTERKVRAITPLNPDCNYLDVLERHLGVLAAGKPVLKPVYHHTHGTLERPEYVAPRQYVIVEGLLGLHTAAMRSHYDVSVYLDPPEELRHAWKITRDTTKRNYAREVVLAELETREEDSARFIRPQRDEADIVVRFSPSETDGGDTRGRFNVRLLLRSRLPHPDLTDVLAIAMGDPPPLR